MCGVVGFLNSDRSLSLSYAEANLRAMAKEIAHRGPDDSGQWCDIKNGIFLGHKRLSILDLSSAGHQPMASSTKRFQIVYNGEIYNHLDLRSTLLKENLVIKWVGTSDTETLLSCFEHYGIKETLNIVEGMFAMAVWDRQKEKLFLIRDRFGEKPLYYTSKGLIKNSILFGSELSALKAHPLFSSEVDNNALTEFMRLGYVPNSTSIYKGVLKVKPGSIVEIDPKSLESKEEIYWDSWKVAHESAREKFKGNIDEACEVLKSLLVTKVKKRMISDVPLGAFLSGGIDSSLITSIMQSISSKPIKTFTIGFNESDWDEAQYAKSIANYLGTTHHEEYVSHKDAIEIIPQLSQIYSEPLADPSQIPTYILSKITKKNVVVALSGDGGDELFCGYSRYESARRIWNILSFFPLSLRKVLKNRFMHSDPDKFNLLFNFLRKSLPFVPNWKNPGDKILKGINLIESSSHEEMYLKMVEFWDNAESVVLNNEKQIKGSFFSNQSNEYLLKSFEDTDRAMLIDTNSFLPEDILVKVDRAAMAVSLETRVPLLDADIYKFAWSLPISMKLQQRNGKKILKKVLEEYQ